MTGIDRGTITNMLVALGAACAEYQDKALRDLPCQRIQCDEIWAFCYAKDKNVPASKQGQFGFGSIWTWTALDADTKLIASWMVGTRDTNAAHEFIQDLAGRLRHRVQLTTDGHKPYLEAVDYAFSGDIDYAQLIKMGIIYMSIVSTFFFSTFPPPLSSRFFVAFIFSPRSGSEVLRQRSGLTLWERS